MVRPTTRPEGADRPAIVINGDLGSGKSTVSVEVARRLGVEWICVGDLYREMARRRRQDAAGGRGRRAGARHRPVAVGYFAARVRPGAVYDWAGAHGTNLPVPAGAERPS